MSLDHETLVGLTTEIVSAHVSNNRINAADVTRLIESVYGALASAAEGPAAEEAKPQGAVSLRASIKRDHLISMLDGKPCKMLKRHLALHGYTPESYRETFNLPRDYPMVAASYTDKRRVLALEIGLGRKPGSNKAASSRKPRSRKAPQTAGPANGDQEAVSKGWSFILNAARA